MSLSSGLVSATDVCLKMRWCRGFLITGAKMLRRMREGDTTESIVRNVAKLCEDIMGEASDPRERVINTDDTSRQFWLAVLQKFKDVYNALKTTANATKPFTSNQTTSAALAEIIVAYATRSDMSSAILMFDQAVLYAARGMHDKMQILCDRMCELIEVIEAYLD